MNYLYIPSLNKTVCVEKYRPSNIVRNSSEYNTSEEIYLDVYKTEKPKCLFCDNFCTFISYKDGYRSICGCIDCRKKLEVETGKSLKHKTKDANLEFDEYVKNNVQSYEPVFESGSKLSYDGFLNKQFKTNKEYRRFITNVCGKDTFLKTVVCPILGVEFQDSIFSNSSICSNRALSRFQNDIKVSNETLISIFDELNECKSLHCQYFVLKKYVNKPSKYSIFSKYDGLLEYCKSMDNCKTFNLNGDVFPLKQKIKYTGFKTNRLETNECLSCGKEYLLSEIILKYDYDENTGFGTVAYVKHRLQTSEHVCSKKCFNKAQSTHPEIVMPFLYTEEYKENSSR